MYNDGTKVDVTSLCTLSINGELTTEDNTVVVTYGNFTASYNIVVVEAQATPGRYATPAVCCKMPSFVWTRYNVTGT